MSDETPESGAGFSMPFRPFRHNFCGTCGRELIPADDGQSVRPHCPDCNRFYYYNPVPAACCFLTNGAGELLLVQRSVEPRRGYWTLPGGFVEVGETPEQGALRELFEETGLTGTGTELLGISCRPSKTSGGIIVIGYTVREWSGAMEAKTDAMDLGFFSLEKRPPIAFEVHEELLAIYDRMRSEG